MPSDTKHPAWLQTDLARLPVLSVRQPWAHSIVSGTKRIENRSRRWSYRGRFLIHAAKGFTDADLARWISHVRLRALIGETWVRDLKVCDLQFGGVVGVARLCDCVATSASPWFVGKWGFVLDEVESLEFYPCRGMLGFFQLPLAT